MSEITLSLCSAGCSAWSAFRRWRWSSTRSAADCARGVAASLIVFATAADNGRSIRSARRHPPYLRRDRAVDVRAGARADRVRVSSSGAFLLGVGPAVHPSVGIWVGSVAVAAFAWTFAGLRAELRPAVKCFLAGCAITLLSAAVQFAFIYDVPQVDAAAVERSFSTFERLWDAHRRARVTFADTGVTFNRTIVALTLIWLIGFARDLPRPALFLLRVAAIAGVISLGVVFLTWMPPDSMPHDALDPDAGAAAELEHRARRTACDRSRGGLSPPHRRASPARGVDGRPPVDEQEPVWRWLAALGIQPWSVRVDPVLLFEAAGPDDCLRRAVAGDAPRGRTAARDGTRAACRSAGCFVAPWPRCLRWPWS